MDGINSEIISGLPQSEKTGKVGSDDWFEKNKNRLQKVLPDTVLRMIEENSSVFRSRCQEKLLNLDWIAVEHHDIEDLPSLNVMLAKDDEKAREMIELTISKMRNVRDFFSYDSKDLPGLGVYIDPTGKALETAKAFYNPFYKNLFIESEDGPSLDHELTHWATLIGEEKRSSLLEEGIATWAAWEMKNKQERTSSPGEDYIMIARRYWSQVIKRDELTIDGNFHNVPAMYLGGVLFKVIYEQLGSNPKKIGEAWKSSANFDKPSEWIQSLGLDSEVIQKKWRNLVFGDKKRFRSLREFFNREK